MNTNTPTGDTPAADGNRAHGDAESAPGHRSPSLHPLYEPLPYGTGFTDPEPLGFGIAPAAARTGTVEVSDRRRAGSPVLAVAGLASLGVAAWAILGAPVITPTVLLAAALVLTVLVGLIMVVRR
ncbi:hypothetical protein [Dietzia sp. B32]|uniref:hypothetical protein n=1 Tax=Dietzia sp. B32 TaxID=2915130 RepID=UPI0021AD7EAD|nr:hypothetical protein [Dietzia sp. B32]UVE94924.1 hypothetical protein L8M95_15685 [Dietzia sp. B32]